MIYFRYSLPAWPQLNQILWGFSARMCTERLSTAAAAAEDRIKKSEKRERKMCDAYALCVAMGFYFYGDLLYFVHAFGAQRVR